MKFGGAAILWSSKTQDCLTSSSSETKYVALADRAKGVLYLKMPLKFLRPELPKMRVKVSEDREDAIKLASNPIYTTNRTKHGDVKHHFLREMSRSKKYYLLAEAPRSRWWMLSPSV